MRKGNRLQFTVYSFLIFVLLSTVACTLSPVLAAESSPSANLSDELKVKLDELKKEIASKAAKLKQEINLKLRDKAYTGVLKSKTETSLTLASPKGARIVTVNQDTVFESGIKSKSSQAGAKQKFSVKTLSEEDYVAALGDIDDNGVLTARKIALLPQQKEAKTYSWGQIVSISDKLLTVSGRDLKNIAVTLAQAEIKKGETTVSANGLNLREFIIFTGTPGKNGIFQADFIYVIPQGGAIKPKKAASPSAKKVN